jgi:NAD(P)-dependent dehydrogenase (short-subunit alcohol dehydrogenase family)
VTLESSVLAAADHIRTTAGRLDILVNNAGILLDDGLPSEITLDVLRRTYQTNVLGAVAVLQAMLPLLQRSQAGRIVNVSSHLASLTLNSDPGFRGYGVKLLAYNSSKTALNAVTVLFAHQLRDTAIKVNAAAPGPVATGLIDNKGAQPPEEGARIVLRLAMLPPDGPTGGFFDSDGPVPW